MLRKANIKAFMNKVQLKYSGHRSKTQIYSYANVTDYHFLHAFDFPHLDHLCAVAQLPQTSQIVSCCLNSHWLHCVVLCGRLHPLQLAKQTTNISFQIGFSSLPSLHSRDGERARRRQEKVWSERRNESRKKPSSRWENECHPAEHDRDVRNANYVLPLSASLSSTSLPAALTYFISLIGLIQALSSLFPLMTNC